jgi:hypothetical protein
MTEQEIEIFSSWKKLAILKEFKGTLRTPEDVFDRLSRTGKSVSKGLINKTLELALECGFAIHERYGKRYKYETTQLFNQKYKQLSTTSVEELDNILNS